MKPMISEGMVPCGKGQTRAGDPAAMTTAKGGARLTQALDIAGALVAAMTLDEKIGMVSSYFPTISPLADAMGMTPSAGYTPGIARLGIPALRISDASLGVANALNARKDDTATALPSALAAGASFDPDLACEAGAMIAREARAKTFNMLLAGGINLTRDPWSGRNFEYIGEDPLLSGHIGGAMVRGVQGENIASTVKHFALNAQETGRMVMNAEIHPEDLHESDLLAFEIAMEVGRPASVMMAYNRVNGVYASENAALIDTLKQQWGFPGWVMSDWGGQHSTQVAAMAGLDQESGIELDAALNGAVFFTDQLRVAVEAGDVPLDRLDDMVTRILVGMTFSGLLDHPVPSTPQPLDSAANGRIAQRLAEAGMVLLRNQGGILPLERRPMMIAVIGGDADLGVASGGGSSQVRSIGGAPIEEALEAGDAAWFCRKTYHASSPLAAIRAAAPDADVRFADGRDRQAALALAREADVTLIFAVQWQTEAMDARSLSLPDDQDALIMAVAAVSSRSVVVLETGGPVLMPWTEHVDAVLAAWYAGQCGGEAIARLLFGDICPSGRLPISFPAAADQPVRPVPPGLDLLDARDAARRDGQPDAAIAPFDVTYVEGANVGYRWYEIQQQKPRYAFGYGLSYTDFSYDDIVVNGGARPSVGLCVSNMGACAGADVAQIYVRAADRLGRHSWRLAGFARVELGVGEMRRIEIALEPRCYARWDDAGACWRLDKQQLEIAVGRSAEDHLWTGLLEIGPDQLPDCVPRAYYGER